MMRSRRRWRWPDGYYHVFNRGSRRLQIFATDADRADFVRLLGKCAGSSHVDVVAWILMGNHYHLCLKGSGEAIGKLIRDLEKTYSRRFNRRTGFEGTLFEGRFKSGWLPDLESVAYVSRYIHANSRDLGIAPDRYRWSSVGNYLGRSRAPSWLQATVVLDYVGGPAAYAGYLADVPERRKRSSEEDDIQGVFVEHLLERVTEALAGRSELVADISIAALTAWLASRAFGVRPKILAGTLGYSSGHCVSTLIYRMNERLRTQTRLKALVEGVLIK